MLRRALLTAAAAGLLAPGAAHASTYEVLSCGAAGGVNHAWTAETSGAGVTATDACGSTGAFPADDVFMAYGASLGVYTTLGAPDPPVGAYAYWRFEVPDPLRIIASRGVGHSHSESDGWRLVTETDAGETGHCQTNEPGSGVIDYCDISGGTASTPLPASSTPGPSTKWLRFGFRCTVAPCDTGTSNHAAGSALYSSGMTVSDQVAPAVAMTPVAPSVSANGTVSATVSGSDQTGVSRLELVVDGQVVASSSRSCDFTRILPCESPGGQVSAQLTSNGLTPGTHQVVGRAYDAAGNAASTAAQAVVATNPPSSTPTPTTPPVPTPTPGPPGTPQSGPTPTPGAGGSSIAAKLKISSVSRSGSRVRVRGSIAKGCRSRLTVKITAAGRTRTARVTSSKSGRWGVWVSGVRRHTKLHVKVSAKATGSCTSGHASTSRP